MEQEIKFEIPQLGDQEYLIDSPIPQQQNLGACLDSMSLDQLYSMAQIYCDVNTDIPETKKELVEYLEKNILEFFELYFSINPEQVFAVYKLFFLPSYIENPMYQKILNQIPAGQYDQTILGIINETCSLGLAFAWQRKDGTKIIVPEELKSRCLRIESGKENFEFAAGSLSGFIQLERTLVSLYGICTDNVLIAICKQFYQAELTRPQAQKLMEATSRVDGHFAYNKRSIFTYDFVEEEDLYDHLVNIRKDSMPFVPSNQELLDHSLKFMDGNDWEYDQETEEFISFQKCISELTGDEFIYIELLAMVHLDFTLEDVVEYISQMGIKLNSAQIKKLVPVFMKLQNTLHLWSKYGNTASMIY